MFLSMLEYDGGVRLCTGESYLIGTIYYYCTHIIRFFFQVYIGKSFPRKFLRD